MRAHSVIPALMLTLMISAPVNAAARGNLRRLRRAISAAAGAMS
jgi:hypothetical protein